MSVMDKFLNAMRLNSEEEEDDYLTMSFMMREDEEYEPPRKPFRKGAFAEKGGGSTGIQIYSGDKGNKGRIEAGAAFRQGHADASEKITGRSVCHGSMCN